MIEIILAIAGIYTLVSGRVPDMLVGGKGYELIGNRARIIGALLLLPIPFSCTGTFLLGSFIRKDAVFYGLVLEVGILVTISIITILLVRQYRTEKAASDNQKPEKNMGPVFFWIFVVVVVGGAACMLAMIVLPALFPDTFGL
jgi:hypothetical protein